jgi:hypothetical protein
MNDKLRIGSGFQTIGENSNFSARRATAGAGAADCLAG